MLKHYPAEGLNPTVNIQLLNLSVVKTSTMVLSHEEFKAQRCENMNTQHWQMLRTVILYAEEVHLVE